MLKTCSSGRFQITSLQETESRNYLVMINKQLVECFGTLGWEYGVYKKKSGVCTSANSVEHAFFFSGICSESPGAPPGPGPELQGNEVHKKPGNI